MEDLSPLSPALDAADGSSSAAPAPAPASPDAGPFPSLRKTASPMERAYAWLLLGAGYLFWRVFPMSEKPLGAVLFLLSLFALTFLSVLRGRTHFGAVQKLVLLSVLLASLAALLWDNGFLSFICFVYLMMAYCYLVYAASGNTLEEGLSTLVGADLVRALLVYPFSSFSKLFPALSPGRGKGLWKSVLKVLLGLFLAVLPTFVFGIPVAMYLFGLYVSSVSGSCREKLNAFSRRSAADRRRILSLTTAAAAVLPLLAVYGIFFFSQWSYYTSAFSGVLPQGLSYASYAREGFFQLCAVAGMNFLVMLCILRYVNRKRPALLRTLCIMLALFTLILLGTAASKLYLYIARYGLTPDRVYAAWFMGLLAVLFVLQIVGQFVPSFKTLPLCLAVTVVLFLLFALSGPNRWIAEYNVGRYLSGSAEEIDLDIVPMWRGAIGITSKKALTSGSCLPCMTEDSRKRRFSAGRSLP